MTNPSINILRIDSSARREGSETRALNDALISRIGATANTTVIHRDLAADLPNFVTETWVGANFTDPNARSASKVAELAGSDIWFTCSKATAARMANAARPNAIPHSHARVLRINTAWMSLKKKRL